MNGDRAPIVKRGSWGGPPSTSNYRATPNSEWDSSMIAILPGIIIRGDKVRMMKWADKMRHGQEHEVDPITNKAIPTGGLVTLEWRAFVPRFHF